MGSIPIVSWLAGCCPLTRFYAQGRNNCFWKNIDPETDTVPGTHLPSSEGKDSLGEPKTFLPLCPPPSPFHPIYPLSNEPDHWALKAEKHFIVPDCKRLALHRKGQSPSLVCRIVSIKK